jgi:hypothetical protein
MRYAAICDGGVRPMVRSAHASVVADGSHSLALYASSISCLSYSQPTNPVYFNPPHPPPPTPQQQRYTLSTVASTLIDRHAIVGHSYLLRACRQSLWHKLDFFAVMTTPSSRRWEGLFGGRIGRSSLWQGQAEARRWR